MDLIERSALKKHVCDMCDDGQRECKGDESCAILCWINDIPAADHWVSCSEMLPEQTGYYLVCDSTAEFDNIKGRQDVSKYVIGRHGGHWYGAIRREHITHWMPLPELPKREV